MKEGIHVASIHGYRSFIKIIDGKPHIPDKVKGKRVWTETVMEESRLETFRPVDELEIIEMVAWLSRE